MKDETPLSKEIEKYKNILRKDPGKIEDIISSCERLRDENPDSKEISFASCLGIYEKRTSEKIS